MPLEHKLSDPAALPDGTQYIVSDAVGDYDANTNTGGYGAPNEVRTDFALMIVPYYHEYVDGKLTPVELVPATYDPVSVADFGVPTEKDGYYSHTVYWVPIADYNSSVPTTEDLEASAYDTVEQNVPVLYKSNAKRNSILAKQTDNFIKGMSSKNDSTYNAVYEKIRSLQEAATVAFCTSQYFKYSQIVEAINKVCNV